MKARLFDRILLGAFLVIILVACALGGLLLVRFPASLYDSFAAFSGNDEFVWWAGGVLLLIALITLYLLFAPSKKAPQAVVMKTESQNTIRITFQALEQIARRYVADYPQVLSSQYKFSAGKTGVTLLLRLSLKPDAVIPEITHSLHDGLIDHMLKHSGLQLSSVELVVEPAKEQPAQPSGVRVQ